MQKFDVIVIGGGASGMMSAGRAAERGLKVLLLEKNKQLGQKLAISGGGRCNITNAEENEHLLLSHYGAAEKFLYSPFVQFGPDDTFHFFTMRGLPLMVQAGKRAFPKTERATDVVKVLEEYLKKGEVEVRTKVSVQGFVHDATEITGVKVNKEVLIADSYILATGGKSRPETGSTGDGFKWLVDLGHKVQEPTPTIVPLAVRDAWIKSLAGISLDDVKITFFVEGEKKLVLKGRVLCTHFGLSGPLILNAAGKVADLLHAGPVTAAIDLFPTKDLGTLDTFMTGTFDSNKNKVLKNVFRHIVSSGTAQAILSLATSIDPEKKVHSVSKIERKALVHLLKALPVTITGLMGYERAVVADGGVALSEIDAKTMRSRRFENLFVTGDLLHVSRPSGGYSLQLCWTTGWVAGSSV
jgi:predicted Rossmann fold flavoprotein